MSDDDAKYRAELDSTMIETKHGRVSKLENIQDISYEVLVMMLIMLEELHCIDELAETLAYFGVIALTNTPLPMKQVRFIADEILSKATSQAVKQQNHENKKYLLDMKAVFQNDDGPGADRRNPFKSFLASIRKAVLIRTADPAFDGTNRYTEIVNVLAGALSSDAKYVATNIFGFGSAMAEGAGHKDAALIYVFLSVIHTGFIHFVDMRRKELRELLEKDFIGAIQYLRKTPELREEFFHEIEAKANIYRQLERY